MQAEYRLEGNSGDLITDLKEKMILYSNDCIIAQQQSFIKSTMTLNIATYIKHQSQLMAISMEQNLEKAGKIGE